jgi:hypothetical protein
VVFDGLKDLPPQLELLQQVAEGQDLGLIRKPQLVVCIMCLAEQFGYV